MESKRKRGKDPIKVYVYNLKGKYIEMHNSVQEFRRIYFSEYKGVYPVFRYNELEYDYGLFEDRNMIVFKYRPGRDVIIHILRIHKSVLCKKADTLEDTTPVQVFNLRGELIAEFKSVGIAISMMPNVSMGTIYGQLNRKTSGKGIHRINSIGFWARYKDSEEVVK